MPHRSLRRGLQVALAARPASYAAALAALGRGSAEKRAYLRLLRRSDVVLDVGANEGYFTLLFSDIVGSGGRVHGFEPVAPTYQRLASRLARDRWFDNVTVHETACWDSDGVSDIFVPGTDWGQASLARHASGSWRATADVRRFEVRRCRLDRYLVELGCAVVDFIKMDVEGAELPGLRGLQSVLQTRPPLLAIELCAAWTHAFGYTPRDLLEFLGRTGYDRFLIVDDALRDVAPDQAARCADAASVTLVCGVQARHGDRLAPRR